ncbi:MAG: SdrD B-like domain-containing protein [Blastocatellia bacterium]
MFQFTEKHTQIRSAGIVLTLISLLIAGVFYWQSQQESLQDRVAKTLKKNAETVRFLENKGQLPDKNVLYYFDAKQGSAYVERDRIRFVAYETEEREAVPNKPSAANPKKERVVKSSHSFSLNLEGANQSPTLKLGKSFGTRYNYFLGNDSAEWTTGIQAAKDLTLEGVYPGIDLRLYSTDEGSLEFDWVLAAGADYSQVKMNFAGQDNLAVAKDGSLQVGLRFTDVKFHLPESYQVTESGKQNVNFAFNKSEDGTVTFTTGDKVDARYPLVIDPVLGWGTFMDGNGVLGVFDEYLFAIQTDTDGITYCAGATNVNIPTASAPYDADGYLNTITGLTGGSNIGRSAAVVYRVSANGTDLLDLTLYGPNTINAGNDVNAYALSLSANRVFVGGYTEVDVPITAGAFDNTRTGDDGFVAVFPKNLGALDYATYIGGTGTDTGVFSIRAIDDNTFVIGANVAAALPAAYISGGAADSTAAGAEAYIARFSTLSTLTYGTYVGGAANEAVNDIEVQPDGRVVFIGTSNSALAEVNGAAASSAGADNDFMIGLLNNAGTAFDYLDKIGGIAADRGYDAEVYNGKIYFTGVSGSATFPVTAGAFDTTINGTTDAIAGVVDLAGGSANYKASFYGGSGGSTLGNGIKLLTKSPCIAGSLNDPVVLLFGTSSSSNLPLRNVNAEPFYSATRSGGLDIFFAGFSTDLTQVKYATYLGGTADDYLGNTGAPAGANHLWFDDIGNIFLGTTTHSGTHTPALAVGGFDTSKSNTTNDSHILIKLDVSSLAIVDYSDAPACYGAPLHATLCSNSNLRIGATIDPELGAIPTAAANGDDADNTDDEDGVAVLPVLTVGGPQNISITVNPFLNTTGSTANLYAWIDLNGDCQFQASEIQTVTVANGFAGSVTLNWTGVTVTALTQTYLRLRLTTDSLADVIATTGVDERSTIAAGNGEVEDYVIPVSSGVDLSIVKDVTPTSYYQGTATNVTYTFTVTNHGPSPVSAATVTDNAPANVTFNSWTCAIGLAGTGVGTNACGAANGVGNIGTTVSLKSGATAVYTINATIGAGATGTITNTAFEALPPGVTQDPNINRPDSDPADVLPIIINIAKSEAVPTPTGPNTYSLSYTITATNSGLAAGNYNLDDLFQFGTGVSVVGSPVATYSGASTDALGTAINGGFTGTTPNTRVVTNEPIGAGLTDVFTVTVNISVNPATATATSVDCTIDPGETGTGTRNTATLSGNASGNATACQPLPLIQILKTQPAPIATGPNTYLLTYTITVSNIGAASGTYNLDDTFQFGTGISVVGSPTVTYSAASTDTLTTTINAGFAGVAPNTRIVTAEPIAGSRTDVYTISVNITVDSATATPTSLNCNLDPGETGTGTRNNATLGGNSSGSSTSCQPLANIVIAKTAAVPTPTGVPNQHQIVYTINISNLGAAAGTYNLDDTFQFGTGVTVVGTPVVAYSVASTDALGTAINTGFTGSGTNTRIVTTEPLAAAEADIFTVTVIVQVNPATATGTSLDCNLGVGETGTGLRNTATLGGNAAGSATACQPLPLVNIAKSEAVPTPIGANTYSLTYTITASNIGAAAGSYNLSDAFQFGTGISVMGTPMVAYSGASTDVLSSTINGGFTGAAPNTGIVTGETIDANQTDVFTVTVIVQVNPATASGTSLNCNLDPGETGTGTRNTATLGGNAAGSATACQPLPLVNIVKTQAVPVRTGPTSFTLVYTLTVTNAGAASGTYNLDDQFQFGAGIAVVGTPVVAYSGASTDTLTTAINPLFNGSGVNTGIVTNEPIANGLIDVFTVTVNVTVDPVVANPTDLDCNLDPGENGTGTRNSAMLSGNASGNSTACQPLTFPILAINKTEAVPTPTGPNTYNVVYTLTVNNTGSATGTYNLDDAFQFGTGVSVVGVPAVAYSGASTDVLGTAINPAFTGAVPNQRIVTNETVAAGRTDVFTITVSIVVDPMTASTSSLDCSMDLGETGTGTRNTASIAGDGNGSATACQPLPLINVLKIQPAPIPTGANTYLLTYTLTVSNVGAAAGTYNLNDTFQFGMGVSVVGMPTVTYAGVSTDTLTTAINASFTGAAPNTGIVTGEPLAPSRADVFTVSVNIMVGGGATSGSLDCNLDVGETGTGTRNTASLGGNAAGISTSCQPLANIVIGKSAAPPVPGALPGQYSITYTLNVRNLGAAAGDYDLRDLFQFGAGVTVLTAPVVAYSGTSTDSLTTAINPDFNGAIPETLIVSAEPLAAGLVDVFTVTVGITVDPFSATPTSLDCTPQPGEIGTGLQNTATLRGNSSGSATDCQPIPTFSLGNRVWKDLNNSGTVDGADGAAPGVNGVLVRLLEAGSLLQVATTVTANGGYYRFDNLVSANYIVEIAPSNFAPGGALAGCVSSGPDAGDPDADADDSDDNGVGMTPTPTGIRSLPISLGAANDEPATESDFGAGDPAEPNASTNLTVDFGFAPTFSLGNRVWKDANNSGTIDSADGLTPGINGVRLQLLNAGTLTQATDANGVPVPNQVTANGGYYRFDNLLAGDYVVRVLALNFSSDSLSGCVSSGPDAGDPDADSGDSDDNGVGIIPGATGIDSLPVTLGAAVGSEPSGETDLSPTDPAEPNGNTNLTVDFGFIPAYSLGNRIWKDLNNSGTIDAADGPTPGVNGVTVRLLNATTLVQATDITGALVADQVTANGGYYRFDNLAGGDYIVEIRSTNFTGAGVLVGCLSSSPDAGDPDTDVDDSDDNGVGTAPAAFGIRSNPVTLGPAPNSEPTNETDRGPTDPAEPNGSTNLTVDFGFVPTFSLGNRVWKDLNNSGTIDAADGGTPGVNGVVVRLLNATTLAQTVDINGVTVADQATTNGGYYRFDNLAAGDYVVEIRSLNFAAGGMLFSCVSSAPDAGDPDADVDDSDDNGVGVMPGASGIRSLPVTLGPAVGSEPTNETDRSPSDPVEPNGSTNLTVDFGFVPTFALGNRVWKDLNNSGTIDAADGALPGIAGVVLRLLNAGSLTQATDANGNPVPNQTTSGFGYYRFDNLLAGDYVVEIVASNFTGAGALVGCISSTGAYEPAPDPDANPADNDDNGETVGSVVRSKPVTLGPAVNSEPTNESDIGPTDPLEPNGWTNLTVDFGFYGQTDLSMTKTVAGDPCNGATITYTLTVRNNGPSATSTTTTVTDTLPAGITPVAASGTGWTCSIVGQTVTCTTQTPIAANATSTVTITAGIGYNVSGATTNTATVSIPSDPNPANNSGSVTINVVSGLAVPGQPFENNGSSVLVYPIFTSNASDSTSQNTRINLTNIHTQKSICVHLFFVDGASCSIADSIVCLTPNQTTSFLASDLDPGTTGYLVAVAIDCNGCPTNFNFLVGDEYVKFASGHRGNIVAEGAAALPGLPTCDNTSVTATLNFDGVSYSRFGRTLALDNFGSRADGNDTMLIVDRVGGNLGTGAATLGTLFGIMYDDSEIGVSFNVSGLCQLRSSLSNNFPRTTPRFETFVPAGRTGWLKLFSQSNIALVGASINHNANAGASAGAFNGAHNLHKLTLSSAGSYVIPVFPANGCQ